MLVEIRDAVFGYGARRIVRVDHLQISAGRCLGIFGPNGAGKTTLVRGLTGLLAPLSGTIVRNPDRAGAAEPIRFGYLPQHRSMDRQWPMTALDAAAMAVSARKRFGWIGRNVAAVVKSMGTMGVEELARRPFTSLSGGQQQRVLLAGALAADPTVLVLDEATEGLDVRSTEMLLDMLRRQTKEGLSTVFISHDMEDLIAVADEIAWLHPPDVPEEPSQIEVISPGELVHRVAAVRRAV